MGLRRRHVSRLIATATIAAMAAAAVATASPVSAHSITPSSVGKGTWVDFNGDGFADLAIGVPLAKVGSATAAGAVVVIYGSATGLDSSRHQEIDQGTSGISGTPETNDDFGSALAAGDVDGDGFGDLIVGIPGETVTINGHTWPGEGAIQVIYGGNSGLGTRDRIWFPSPGAGVDATQWNVGFSVVALDAYNGSSPGHDGKADIGVGIPGANGRAGGFALVSSARMRATGSGPVLVVRGGFPKQSQLGFTIGAGDFNSNTTDDLVIGAPFAPVDDPANPGNKLMGAGKVEVRYGGSNSTKLILAEGTNGVPGTPAADDGFGRSLAIAHDPNGNAYDSLWVGAPFHDTGQVANSGIVYRFDSKANGSGIDPAGGSLHEGTAKFSAPLKADDYFGSSIAVGDFGRGAGLDVAVGAPGLDLPSKPAAGALMVSNDDGTSDVITQDLPGYEGTSGSTDEYARVVFAANFGNGGKLDLAVGIDEKNVNGTPLAGQVHVLYGSVASGFTSSNDQIFDLTDGFGLPLQGGLFGFALR